MIAFIARREVIVRIDDKFVWGVVSTARFIYVDGWVSVQLDTGGFALFGDHPWNVTGRPLTDVYTV